MEGKRVRLTARRREASDATPYPGTVNQEDRQFVERDEYDSFEHTVNYELPDMRTEWRNDSRDEIGFPIAEEHAEVGVKDQGQVVASVAQVRQAASKAVKLSMLLLGNKVGENLIEAQAKDFMRMGSSALDRALVRFAKTEELYAKKAEDEGAEEEAPKAKKSEMSEETKQKFEENAEKVKDGVKPAKKGADEAEEEVEDPKAKKSADEGAEEEVEAPKAKKGGELPEALQKFNEEKKEKAEEKKSKKSAEEAEEEVEAPKAKKSAEEAEEEAPAEEAPKAKKSADDGVEEDEGKKAAELDIELSASEEEDTVEDAKSASILSSLYEEVKRQGAKAPKAEDEEEAEEAPKAKKSADEEAEEEVEAPKAKKASRGAQKLGGQPKVASDMSVKDISSIWGETPDISGVFE